MGLFTNKFKKENEELKKMLSPEMQAVLTSQENITQLNSQIEMLKTELSVLNDERIKQQGELYNLNVSIKNAKEQLVTFENELTYQGYGIYTPRYAFTHSDEYKERLTMIRDAQKAMIKNGTAASGTTEWTVNGDTRKGAHMVKDMQKLLLRAFNTECDDIIDKVKYSNLDASLKRIDASCTAISKLGKIMNIVITKPYHDLKIEELHLAYEYQLKKQEEKEEMRAAREAMREAEKLQKEIEAQRKKIEKEQQHYTNALAQILKQIESTDAPTSELLDKKAELEKQLGDIKVSLSDLDYREANQRAGYVYIISNIGAFGENVYKIGMTRRLEPQDRVDELGDASVPFRFDVHAMIFSDDAPALEAALHRAFEDRKVNMINHRREFFNVTLDEIKAVVRANYDKTVEFYDFPEADQYRQSLALRNHNI